ncbi:MAG TPA: ECF-type sigma factor [Chiayiivirga sp.]|nr:ECF-type sigma factor [Chiayiivirga sp.]
MEAPQDSDCASLHPHLYQRLRDLARRQMRGEPSTQSLDTTSLVHEAWLDLAGHDGTFTDTSHFYAYAATVMRHILVDHARHRLAHKRGSGEVPLDLDSLQIPVDHAATEMLAMDQALSRLAALEPRLARVVELRFFAGLSVEETAEVLGIVPRSVVRDWARARAFLQQALA